MDKLVITYADLFNDHMIRKFKSEYLKWYRVKKLGMTLEEVEGKFGIDKGYLSRMENGKSNPKIYWNDE